MCPSSCCRFSGSLAQLSAASIRSLGKVMHALERAQRPTVGEIVRAHATRREWRGNQPSSAHPVPHDAMEAWMSWRSLCEIARCRTAGALIVGTIATQMNRWTLQSLIICHHTLPQCDSLSFSQRRHNLSHRSNVVNQVVVDLLRGKGC